MLDVVEDGHDQVVPRDRKTVERSRGGGVEQDVKVAVSRHEGVEVAREQAAGGVRVAARRPFGARPQDREVAVEAHVDVAWDVNLEELKLVAFTSYGIRCRGVEGVHDRDPVAFKTGRLIVARVDEHVLRVTLENKGGVGKSRAAFPHPRLERVPRIASRPLAEVSADPHGVFVDPRDEAARFGPHEAAFAFRHEASGFEIPFARDVGIASPVREAHEEATIGRAFGGTQCVGAVPHPILAFGDVEGVDIDEGFPLGVLGTVGVEGRAAPHTALMLGVCPKVVEEVAPLSDAGNPITRVEDLEDFRFEFSGERIGVEVFFGAGVALANPRELLLTGDVLEPQMRIAHGVSSFPLR